MTKKILPLILLLALLFSLWNQSVSMKKVIIPSQSTLDMGTIDHPASVDPACAIDTASRALVFNVYDPLVFFDRESVGDFIPSLATDWLIEQPPHPDAPEGTNQTWYFRIRGTSGTHTMEGYVLADYPISTSLHETYPWYSTYWHMKEWIDNPLSPDGILSPSDIIKMDRACQNWDGETPMLVNVTQTFHVDEVTIAIIVFHWKSTGSPVVAEPVEDIGSFGPSIGDTYHELSPSFSRLFNITSHEDTDGNGIINRSEQFDVEYLDEPGVKRDAQLDRIHINNIVVTEQPVKFHDGSSLTAEDVEYSFERLMVMDRSGGPAWMINEPLFGDGWPDKSGWPEAPGNPIDTAVESNSTHIWFNLAMPYPPFMQILCGSWASIVNKEFCVANGDWCGEWAVTGEAVGTGDGTTTVFSLDYPPVVSGSEMIDWSPVVGEAVGTGDGTTTVFSLDYPPVLEGSETIYLDVTGEDVGTGDGAATVFYLDYPPVVSGSETIYLDVTGEDVGTGDGVTTVFYLDHPPVAEDSETIYLDGAPTTTYTINYTTGEITFDTAPGVGVVITADYQQDLDYTVDYSTGQITFSTAPAPGVEITADYQQDIYLPVVGEAVGTGDGATTVFSLDYPPVLEGSETIYLDGSPTTAYTIDYATGEITFDTAPGVGVVITADYQQDYTINYATGQITFSTAPGDGVDITADYQQDLDYTVDYSTGQITFSTAPAPGVEITADYKPSWKVWFDPLISPLDVAGNVMCGTGPYMLDYLNTWGDWRIVAFNKDITWPTGYDAAGINPPHTYEYWGGWPDAHSSRYLEDVTNWVWYEWGIRKSNFETGVADEVYVPAAYLPQMIMNWPTSWDEDARMRLDAEGNPEYYADILQIECLPGLPTLTIDAAMFFAFNVNPASPYVGTGSFPNGIPLNFFSDARIRQAFAYCFDYDAFLEDMYWGEAEQPPSCVIRGLLYHNPANPKYDFNLTKAKELFMAASADPASPAYQVWTKGFNVTMTFNTGNVAREAAVVMMAVGVEDLFALGPDGLPDTGDEAGGTATINVQGLFGPTFESNLRARYMPLFITGWLNEYTDPHDNVNTFMHSSGHFSGFQSYSNATVDALIEQGIATPDGPARQAIYETLQLMYYQDCPSVCLAQQYKRHWEKDWVQGWYHNPLYPGQKYFYHLWKGLNGDINGDNKVDILDLGENNGHWYPGPPLGPLGYDPIADIYPELQYVLFEDPYYPHLYDAIPKVWDGETEAWIPHPSIGEVDIYDAALVSAHWLEEV